MNQAMYAHMNNKRKKKKQHVLHLKGTFSVLALPPYTTSSLRLDKVMVLNQLW
jgi:hypothetical protein